MDAAFRNIQKNLEIPRVSLFITYFICFYLGPKTHAVRSPSFTQQWTTDYYYNSNKPVIVKVENDILIVSLNNNFIDIKSVDGIVINTCKLSAAPFKSVEPLYRAVALGNGKIVAHTVMVPNFPEGRGAWDLFLIVDPRNCSLTKTLGVYTEVLESGLQAIVPYHDSFDLFYSKSVELNDGKTPSRFNDMAEPIDLDHHFALETELYDLQIETVKPYDATEGYICKIVFADGKTTSLWRLNSKFQLIDEREVEPWANIMSAGHSSISICYRRADDLMPMSMKRRYPYSSQDVDDLLFRENPKKLSISCGFFDVGKLKYRTSVRLYRPENDFDETEVDAVNLPDGSTVVALGFKLPGLNEDRSYTTEYYLQRINADGSLNEAFYVGNYTYSFDTMRIVPLSGGEICLVVVGGWFEPFLSSRVSGKCVDMLI